VEIEAEAKRDGYEQGAFDCKACHPAMAQKEIEEAKREMLDAVLVRIDAGRRLMVPLTEIVAGVRALGESEPEKLPLIEDHEYKERKGGSLAVCGVLKYPGASVEDCGQPAAAHRVSK